MYKEIKQDVWSLLDKNSTLYILTNNSIAVFYDAYSMNNIFYNPIGGGIAYEAKVRNPVSRIDEKIAKCIKNDNYFICVDSKTGAELMRFPTMNNINELADIDLIKTNLYRVKDYCISNPDRKVYVPRPGCGIGGLDWEKDIKPLCEEIFKDLQNIYIVSK